MMEVHKKIQGKSSLVLKHQILNNNLLKMKIIKNKN